MRRLLSLLALVALSACSSPFDPASYVAKLRLLNVRAEPAEVAFEQQATLTAFYANPGGPAPVVTWSACPLAPASIGEPYNAACITGDAGAPMLPLGAGDQVSITMPTLTSGMLGLPDETNGVYLPVRLQLDAGDKRLIGMFGLRIGFGALSPNPPNQNPTLTGLYRVPAADAGADMQVLLDDKSPLEVHAQDELHLRALLSPESVESYVVYDGDPRTTPPRTTQELLRVSWYATAGSFNNEVTGVDRPDTTLKLDKHLPASGTLIDLWVVARDDRGGSDLLHRTLQFR